MWPPARRGHRGLRPGGNAEGWSRCALSFFKIDRIHHFDIRHSLFQSFFFDQTGRFFGQRRRSYETTPKWRDVTSAPCPLCYAPCPLPPSSVICSPSSVIRPLSSVSLFRLPHSDFRLQDSPSSVVCFFPLGENFGHHQPDSHGMHIFILGFQFSESVHECFGRRRKHLSPKISYTYV